MIVIKDYPSRSFLSTAVQILLLMSRRIFLKKLKIVGEKMAPCGSSS
jgi:hypothetical protein